MFKHFKIQLTFLFANDVNDRGLIPKIYEPCMQVTTNKMERQPIEWEKIFANKATNKGLVPKISSRSSMSKNKPANKTQ